MGKRLKYYVGYELDGKLTPLSILDDSLQLIGTTLTEVINFTSSFNNEIDLKEAITNGPIDNKIPDGSRLVYIVETNNPARPYKKVLDSNYICYSGDKNYLNPESQKEYIFEYKYDLDFIEKLYAIVIRTNINFDHLKCFCTREESDNMTPSTIISVFRRSKKFLNNSDSFLLNFMDQIYNEVVQANNMGIENYELDHDRLDLDHLIDRFYASYTIKKDKQRNFKYDPNSGKLLRDPRIMGYLTMTIGKDTKDRYEKYVQQLEKEYEDELAAELADMTRVPNNFTRDLYYTGTGGHDEEFLTAADFEDKNLDPESNGYAFRKSGL